MLLKDLLDAIDVNRESEEIVNLMDDSNIDVRARVCSFIWDSIEEREVNSIQARDNEFNVWLND